MLPMESDYHHRAQAADAIGMALIGIGIVLIVIVAYFYGDLISSEIHSLMNRGPHS